MIEHNELMIEHQNKEKMYHLAKMHDGLREKYGKLMCDYDVVINVHDND